MNEAEKKQAIADLNLKIGGDINNLTNAHKFDSELARRRDYLQSCLNVVNNAVPTKISSAIKKAEQTSGQIENLRTRSEALKQKADELLDRTEPLRTELHKRFLAINKLEQVLIYLQSFEKIEDMSQQMKQSNDDEQVVLLYGELKAMCNQYQNGHRASYIKDCTRYWHNVLKDSLAKSYEDVLKLLKWPFNSSAENSPPPKEILAKFTNLTRYLFLIQEPESLKVTSVSGDYGQAELDPCLPVRILLRPLKKRFAFHFTGPRQTARIDRPEWFLTQTLTWVKDHKTFVKNNVQPVADKLELRTVNAVDEFNDGLIALAAERLHTVLAMYTQGSKGEIVDVDTAFAHAVDETLGFNRELLAITGKEVNSVLSVLTKAETFVRWLAVEKKYALAKMEETLSNDQWSEAVASGTGAAVGALVWVPRGADWFITLLKTIEDRYAVLPQPGHRLQFLELQLELVEEWRVRLTQLLGAATGALAADTLVSAAPAAHALTALINAAHHTYTVLLQWAHSLHYLQLHYYRRQFQNFTQHQHHEDESESSSSSEDEEDEDSDEEESKKHNAVIEIDENICLREVEISSHKLAMRELSRRHSILRNEYDITSPIVNLAVTGPLAGAEDAEEAGVFAEAPALLARLRDGGLASLAEHILLEFKAGIKDYKKQKWHALVVVEEVALSVSVALCAPLGALCARLGAAAARLAPPLATHLRAHLAHIVDEHIFEEVAVEKWFNTGGTIQFTHDVKRNLVPAFAPPYKVDSPVNQLPKLLESCQLLNMDYDDSRRLRALLIKQPPAGAESLINHGIHQIPPKQALQILSHRTDLNDTNSPASLLELF